MDTITIRRMIDLLIYLSVALGLVLLQIHALVPVWLFYSVSAGWVAYLLPPDWYYSVVATPDLTVEVGTETFRVHATIAKEPERTRLYNKMVEMMPGFDDYRRKTTRKIPVIMLTPMK